MLRLYAQTVDENFRKGRGLLATDTALSFLDEMDNHVCQLGVFVQIPEVGCGFPTFLLLLFGLISTLLYSDDIMVTS